MFRNAYLASARSSTLYLIYRSQQVVVACHLAHRGTSYSSQQTSFPRKVSLLRGWCATPKDGMGRWDRFLHIIGTEQRHERRWCSGLCGNEYLWYFLATTKKRTVEMETYCHSIPDSKDGNRVGRVERYFSMLWRASIADPVNERCQYPIRHKPRRRAYLQLRQTPRTPTASGPALLFSRHL